MSVLKWFDEAHLRIETKISLLFNNFLKEQLLKNVKKLLSLEKGLQTHFWGQYTKTID